MQCRRRYGGLPSLWGAYGHEGHQPMHHMGVFYCQYSVTSPYLYGDNAYISTIASGQDVHHKQSADVIRVIIIPDFLPTIA
jgi:hypothetical protein